MDTTRKISDLTVSEFSELMVSCYQKALSSARFVSGIKGLAELFGVSETTAKRIKSSGVIDEAISQSGRTIVTDADKAMALYKAAAHKKRYNTK